jgi:hypothetical protein
VPRDVADAFYDPGPRESPGEARRGHSVADEDIVDEDIEFEEEEEDLADGEIDPEELDDDDALVEEDEFVALVEEDELVPDEDEDDEAGSVRRAIPVDDEDDDEDLVDPDDVEADLDTILKDRLVAADEEPDEDDDEVEVDDRGDPVDRIQPKRPGEFVCQSCFLVKHPSQLADAKRQLCTDCV